MRVMQLVHGLGLGGTETMIAALARHLRSRGDVVEIGCLGELGRLGEELRADGFEVVLHERRPGFDRSLPLRLARRLGTGAFDVVHAHQRAAFFYATLAGLLDATPLVYSEHGPLFATLPSHATKVFNRLLAHRARRITAVSEHLKRSLATVEGLDAERIEVVPNAVDLEHFGPRSEAARTEARRGIGISPQARVLGTVGRLDPVKNHVLLLHVLQRLSARVSDVHLVVVGDGPGRPAIEALAAELGVTERLLLLGERRDVAALLPCFDVFCLSSLSEGIPLTLLEAMAAGVPVVSTAAGGIPEAARAGQDALLVAGTPPDRVALGSGAGDRFVASFAAAAESLLLDSALAGRLAGNGRERVSALFSMDAVCRRYAEVLTRHVRVPGTGRAPGGR